MKKYIVAVCLFFLVLFVVFCGPPSRTKQIVIPIPVTTAPLVTCNGAPIGNVRSLLCEQNQTGSITQECKDSGKWETTVTDCKKLPVLCDSAAASKVTFEKDIKPLIDAKCISCHKAIDLDEYGSAKGYLTEIIDRISEGAVATKRMPQPPNDPLKFEERELFTKWRTDGTLENSDCVDPNKPPVGKFIGEDEVRASIIKGLRGLNENDKKNSRFLDNSSRTNLGSSEAEKDTYKASVNKAINAISTERDLVPCTELDADKAVCRLDLDALGMTAADWDLIVANAVLVLEDKTDDGIFIQQQTGTKIPTLQGDQFVRAALDFRLAERQRRAAPGEVIVNPYYAILGIPTDQKAYFALKGVDLQKIFDDFEALCAGNNLSPISLGKNRLVCFVESDDGQCSISFDPLLAVNKSNLFQNPFVFVKSDKIFDFQASEVICDQENGGQEYSLWNSAGVRQDAAPETIVKNTVGELGDTEIRLRTCNECHSKGLIVVLDELRKSILESSKGNFNKDELDFTRLMYGPQGRLDTALFVHNKSFKEGMGKIAVDVGKPDPVNYVVNRFVKQWNLNEVCAMIKLPLGECKQKIDQSRKLSDFTGALTSGGTIGFDLLIDNFQVFIDELRLGQNELGE